MVSYKQSYMTKQAGWLSDAWGNLTNSISNGLMDAQEGISNFFGGTDTAVGRLFAPSLDRQVQVRLGFHKPTGGTDTDYFGANSQINQRITRNLTHLQRADQGLEARTPQELAARDAVQRRQSAQIAQKRTKQQNQQNWNAQMESIAADDAAKRSNPTYRQSVMDANAKTRAAMEARQRDPKAQAAFDANVNAQIAASRKVLADRANGKAKPAVAGGGKINGVPVAQKATNMPGQKRG